VRAGGQHRQGLPPPGPRLPRLARQPARAAEQAEAFVDHIGAEAAVAAWRRFLLAGGASPATVNQGLAAVTLLYEHGAGMRIKYKTARVAPPTAPKALTRPQENALRRTADRRGPRNAAIIYTLLGTGARAEECARLRVDDVAITPRSGVVRLFGKGDQVRTVPIAPPARERLSTWLIDRAELLATPSRAGLAARVGDALWVGKRGPLTVDGITDVVLAAATATPDTAGLKNTRPHELRHTYATRLREDGFDLEQIRALLGHDSLDTTRRYFMASQEEIAELVDRALDY
jgi:site-specific recombinase XerD